MKVGSMLRNCFLMPKICIQNFKEVCFALSLKKLSIRLSLIYIDRITRKIRRYGREAPLPPSPLPPLHLQPSPPTTSQPTKTTTLSKTHQHHHHHYHSSLRFVIINMVLLPTNNKSVPSLSFFEIEVERHVFE